MYQSLRNLRVTRTFFNLKSHDLCCTLFQFFVRCTMSEAVTHFQHLSELNMYILEAATTIGDLFTSSWRGLPLLRNLLRLRATAKPVVDLEGISLRRYATFLCTPPVAVCLLLERGLGKERHRKVLCFIGPQNTLFRRAIGLFAPRPFPGRRTGNAAWKQMAAAMDMGPPRYAKGSTAQGACGIYWKFTS